MQIRASRTKNKTPKKYILTDTRNVICTLYLKYFLDKGLEYLLDCLLKVLLALIWILFCLCIYVSIYYCYIKM